MENRTREYFKVKGCSRLRGSVSIHGSKNAALAILPATLLARGEYVLEQVPDISDVRVMMNVLTKFGAKVERLNEDTYRIDTSDTQYFAIPNNLVKGDCGNGLRGISYFASASLAAFGRADVPMPGGDNFGSRPINYHQKAFEALGAKVKLENGRIITRADKLTGSAVLLDSISVGATINALITAVVADGTTVILNAATEPHVKDLAVFLSEMGANIKGIGEQKITVTGSKKLHGCNHKIIPDQIEAGTYMTLAAACADSDVTVTNVIPEHLSSIIIKLRETGATVLEGKTSVRVITCARPKGAEILTCPHPGFPTDMQSQFAALLAVSQNGGYIKENVFSNRFNYLPELEHFGAKVKKLDSNAVLIEGIPELKPSSAEAVDIRSGASVLIAACCARGESVIYGVAHIDRGYVKIEEQLRKLGVDISRIKPQVK